MHGAISPNRLDHTHSPTKFSKPMPISSRSCFCLLLCGSCALASVSLAEESLFFLGSWRKATVLDCSSYPQLAKEKCDAIAHMEKEAIFSFTADELIFQNGTDQERTPYSYTLLKDGRAEIRYPNIDQAMIFSRQGAQLCATNDKGAPVCYDRVQPPPSIPKSTTPE